MHIAREKIVEALELIGADLEAKGEKIELLVVGGGSLLLLDLVDRPTRDIDVIALLQGERFVKASALPDALVQSFARVRLLLDLPDDWMNVEAADVMDHGLPKDFEQRLSRHEFGGLTLFSLGRLDLICLKLHAATDRGDPHGKHVQDLDTLVPTRDELVLAAHWAMTHDPSAGFRMLLCKALSHWGVNDADDWLPEGL